MGRLAQRLERPVYTRKVECSNHSLPTINQSGDVVQLVRTLPCHGRGREFESRRPRHFFSASVQYLAFPLSGSSIANRHASISQSPAANTGQLAKRCG